ncbi:hypothetical protein D030_1327A, partial [Vibrio parahaemolyticus AQ3810]
MIFGAIFLRIRPINTSIVLE